MIPQSYIEELVQRNDMVDVAQSYVQLRRRGRTYTGLCPFHSEKTPSFVVYPETQSFYCFGCGAGGDVITFIKKINNVDYVEAVKTLAARAGMAMPEEDDKAGRLRSRIVSINKDAARFFVQCLQSEEGRAARRYWRETRGLSPRRHHAVWPGLCAQQLSRRAQPFAGAGLHAGGDAGLWPCEAQRKGQPVRCVPQPGDGAHFRFAPAMSLPLAGATHGPGKAQIYQQPRDGGV